MKKSDELNISDTHALILSGGKISNELETIFGSIPTGLIPLNGKAVIFHIIDKLVEEGFKKISITVGFRKNNLIRIIENHYDKKLQINFIEVDFHKLPGNALIESSKHVKEKKFLTILGDTISHDKYSKLIKTNGSFVLGSKNFRYPEKWCLVESKNGFVSDIFDKTNNITKNKNFFALIGVYFFDDVDLLRSIFEINNPGNIEISTILEKYRQHRKIRVLTAEKWLDVGHKDNYFKSKTKFLKSRYFNYVEFDEILGIVTKRSNDKSKLINEIEWYKKIPHELSVLTPRLVSYGYDPSFIKLEHVKYPTLAELWLYTELQTSQWKNIMEKLLTITYKFKNYPGHVSKKDYEKIYITKTEERISNLIKKSKKFAALLTNKNITINGIQYQNWPLIHDKIFLMTKMLYDETDNCFIHGDLCFSNILFDSNNSIFKLIDPRGKWGSGVFGDLKYDAAKLRHSITGNYDSIVNGLFSANITNDNLQVQIFKPLQQQIISDYFDTLIKKHWDLNKIKLIEGLLFISMLPLHHENFEKQLAFYAVGIERLNELINL